MAEYAQREQRFNDSLAARVGGFMLSVSQADGVARMQDIGITQAILKLPNVTLEQKMDILNRDKPIVLAASHPAVLYAETRPFLAERVELSMSMAVHAATSEEKSVDSTSEGEGKATFGFGLFKGSIGMKASVSTHSNKKRDSDYTATTDMKLIMSRHPAPEGLSKVVEMLGETAKATNDINVALARRELDRLINEEDLQLPEPTPEEGEGETAEE